MSEHTFLALADRLRENRLDRLIPLQGRDKRPRHNGWQQYNDAPVPQGTHDKWVRRGAVDGIGCCSGGELFGLDLDHKEFSLAMTVRAMADEICGASPVWRIGEPYKSMRFYRQAVPITTQAPAHIMAASYGTTGQFVLHHPRHPVTGKPYTYPDGETLIDVPVAELPVITASQVDDLFSELRKLIPPQDSGFQYTGTGGVVAAVRGHWEQLRDQGWEFDDAARRIMATATERHHTMTGLVAFLVSGGWEEQEIIDLIAEPYLGHFSGREIVTRHHKLERSIEGALRKGLGADPAELMAATAFGSWGCS